MQGCLVATGGCKRAPASTPLPHTHTPTHARHTPNACLPLQADVVLGELTHAERQLMEAELEQRQHQVWFWRWKAEARREVEARRPAVEAAQERVRVVRGERSRVLREAKSVLGLWSGEG